MTGRRRWGVVGAGLLPALVLVVAHALAFPHAAEGKYAVVVSANPTGSVVAGGVTLLVLAGVLYGGLRGTDPARGDLAVFLLGWTGLVAATVAGEFARTVLPGGQFGWFAYAPGAQFASLPTLPGHAAQASLLLGWLVGVLMLLAYRRGRRPAASTASG